MIFVGTLKITYITLFVYIKVDEDCGKPECLSRACEANVKKKKLFVETCLCKDG